VVESPSGTRLANKPLDCPETSVPSGAKLRVKAAGLSQTSHEAAESRHRDSSATVVPLRRTDLRLRTADPHRVVRS